MCLASSKLYLFWIKNKVVCWNSIKIECKNVKYNWMWKYHLSICKHSLQLLSFEPEMHLKCEWNWTLQSEF